MARAMTSHNRWFSRAADDCRWGVRRPGKPSKTERPAQSIPVGIQHLA